jgi:hypothetical protein
MLASGKQVSPRATSQQIYYRSRYASGVTIEPMPADLRIVVGNMHATSVATNSALTSGAIRWECHGGSTSYSAPPSCGTNALVENINFPSCWDGTLTHSNDTAHVAFVADDRRCPAAFGHALPRISIKINYPSVPAGPLSLSSGPTYTAHADFWNTWQQAGMRYLVSRCLNAHISCGTNPIAPMGN